MNNIQTWKQAFELFLSHKLSQQETVDICTTIPAAHVVVDNDNYYAITGDKDNSALAVISLVDNIKDYITVANMLDIIEDYHRGIKS